MVDPITLQSISILVSSLGMIIALIYYTQTLRNNAKARQRDMVFQRLQGYSLEYTKAFSDVASYTDWETVEEWNEKYGILTNPEAFSKYLYIQRTFTLAGILLKENMADADLIFQLYPPSAVIRIWEQFEPQRQNARERRNYPTMHEPFDFLYTEVKKRYPEILPSDVWANE